MSHDTLTDKVSSLEQQVTAQRSMIERLLGQIDQQNATIRILKESGPSSTGSSDPHEAFMLRDNATILAKHKQFVLPSHICGVKHGEEMASTCVECITHRTYILSEKIRFARKALFQVLESNGVTWPSVDSDKPEVSVFVQIFEQESGGRLRQMANSIVMLRKEKQATELTLQSAKRYT